MGPQRRLAVARLNGSHWLPSWYKFFFSFPETACIPSRMVSFYGVFFYPETSCWCCQKSAGIRIHYARLLFCCFKETFWRKVNKHFQPGWSLQSLLWAARTLKGSYLSFRDPWREKAWVLDSEVKYTHNFKENIGNFTEISQTWLNPGNNHMLELSKEQGVCVWILLWEQIK